MFRRTFARHVVRYDTTNLMALKEHFKHVSLSTTITSAVIWNCGH
jgi:hypothetical protein